jgi:hypothetical protein
MVERDDSARLDDPKLDDALTSLGALADVPLAEPETVEDLRRRTRRRRARRTTAGLAVLAIGLGSAGALRAALDDDPSEGGHELDLAAPTVLLGNIDASVLSTVADADSSRTRLPASVVAQVAQVNGVASAVGALQRFAPTDHRPADTLPRSPVVISVHEPDEVRVTAGAYPAQQGEVMVTRDVRERYGYDVGATIPLPFATSLWRVSGIFELQDGDVDGAPVIAVPTTATVADPADTTTPVFDRVDVTFADGADRASVMQAIQAVLPEGLLVYEPTTLGTAQQLRAELEIQRAYWRLISADPQERHEAAEAVGDRDVSEGDAIYERYEDMVRGVEMRVARVTFVSPDRATVVYRFYYQGGPSPVFPEPQNGEAVLVDGTWRVAATTTCRLSSYIAEPCEGGGEVTPPTGWDAPSSQPDAAAALAVLADPNATVDARQAAIADGAELREEIAAGVEHDAQYRDHVRFAIAGARTSGPDVELMYSVVVDGGPSTPYPLTTVMTREGDRWVANAQYACGIDGLAGFGCPPATGGPGGGP